MVATAERLAIDTTGAVEQNVGRFRDALALTRFAPRTCEVYVYELRLFLRWLVSVGGDPDQPTRSDVREYRQRLIEDRRKPATVNKKLGAVRSWARLTGRAFGEDVPGVEDETVGPAGLERRQWNALEREAEKAGVLPSAVMQTLLGTGIRIAECAALTVDDLDLGERGGWLSVRYGKGGKARRVPIPVETRRALRLWLEKRGDRPTRDLWLGQRGRMTANGLYRIVIRLVRRAGVAAGPHTLRHTYARRLLGGGAALTELQKLLGHRDIRTTSRYLAPTGADLERTVTAAFG